MDRYDNIPIAGGDTSTPLNIKKRLQIIASDIDLTGKTFVDLGCGAGEYVAILLTMKLDAFGIEYSQDKVDQFKSNYPLYSNRVNQGDIEKTEWESNCMDIVLMNEVLEHVPDQNRALGEAFRILKSGGLFVIFSPNRLYPFETHGVKIKNTQMNLPIYMPFIPYVPLWLGKRILDYWARNYWPWELRKLIETSGFRILKIRYIWQTFENISGRQPRLLNHFRSQIQTLSSKFERTPIIRTLGVSQYLLAQKP